MAENDTTTDASAPSEASPLLISTQSGLVQGLNRDHDVVFYGIPYACLLYTSDAADDVIDV